MPKGIIKKNSSNGTQANVSKVHGVVVTTLAIVIIGRFDSSNAIWLQTGKSGSSDNCFRFKCHTY